MEGRTLLVTCFPWDLLASRLRSGLLYGLASQREALTYWEATPNARLMLTATAVTCMPDVNLVPAIVDGKTDKLTRSPTRVQNV